MTKEAILATKNWNSEYPSFMAESEIHDAMDEWSEQQCIAFANFIAQHNYKPHDIDTWNEGTKNTHELYDDFIEFQRLEQQNKP